jgi:protein subunit release factor B
MNPSGITPSKYAELQRRLLSLGVNPSDLEERFIRGGGAGGQKINKTSSTVVLRHRPTGIEVRCQSERSQALNRFLARRELCDRIEERTRGALNARRQEQERIRRQKRRRSRRQKAIMLADKRHRGAIKSARRRTPGDEG